VADLLADAARERLARTTTAGGTCPYIPLAGQPGFYLATLGSSHRANVRRRIRALDQKFDVRFERVTGDTQRARRSPSSSSITIAGSTSAAPAFGTDDIAAFHDELTRRASIAGWLRMFRAAPRRRAVAVMYGFLYDGTFYFISTASTSSSSSTASDWC